MKRLALLGLLLLSMLAAHAVARRAATAVTCAAAFSCSQDSQCVTACARLGMTGSCNVALHCCGRHE